MPSAYLSIEGTPVPQGSKRIGRHGKRPVILDDNDAELRPWRQKIAAAFRASVGPDWQPLDVPVRVTARFYFERPKSRVDDIYKDTAPDIDKLSRALLDGLADGGAYVNDGRVVRLVADKVYVEEFFSTPGVTVAVQAFTDVPVVIA